MNTENLLRVADAIEKHEIDWLGFNMCAYAADDLVLDRSGHKCGTTACVAGWAFAVQHPGIDSRALCCGGLRIETEATSFLGLKDEERDELFGNTPKGISFGSATTEHAVRTLRYAAEHGRIDWDAANPPVPA